MDGATIGNKLCNDHYIFPSSILCRPVLETIPSDPFDARSFKEHIVVPGNSESFLIELNSSLAPKGTRNLILTNDFPLSAHSSPNPIGRQIAHHVIL